MNFSFKCLNNNACNGRFSQYFNIIKPDIFEYYRRWNQAQHGTYRFRGDTRKASATFLPETLWYWFISTAPSHEVELALRLWCNISASRIRKLAIVAQ